MSAAPAEPPEVSCSKRWFSVDPSCPCPRCRRMSRRRAMQRGHGYRLPDLSDQAWAALDRMLAAGRTVSDIAATAGLDRPGLNMTLSERRQGRAPRFGYVRAQRIIGAEGKPPAFGGRVDATVARRQLQALTAIGYTMLQLWRETGIGEGTLHTIRTPKGVRTTSTEFAYRIDQAYERLSMTPGGSTAAVSYAKRYKFAPPLAWDDIRNPHEKPQGIAR